MILWQTLACCCALASGALFSGKIQDFFAQKQRRKRSRKDMRLTEQKASPGITGAVLTLWQQSSLEQRARNGPLLRVCRSLFLRRSARWMQKQGRFLGMPRLSAQGLSATRFVLCVIGFCGGLVLGYALSLPFAGFVILCCLMAFGMAELPFHIARSYIQQRQASMEQELPQMLAMVALGLHSGLSFDKSFSLYPLQFSTAFAQECVSAQHLWTMSLATREEALRKLGQSYDSALFHQAIESMIRSLRLGTALAENLEALSVEARNQYRSACEEAIAKAPVKMLVPTGALILPAMLMLVMGPVLLEMMGEL